VAAAGETARRAQIADAAEIATLASDYAEALQGARGGEGLVGRVRWLTNLDDVADAIATGVGSALVVGLFDGVVAGFAHAVVSSGGGDDDTSVEIDAMYIDPPLRRVGIGEAMIGEVARYAHEQGASSIDVVTLPGDGATKSFLEASGFRARLLVMHRREHLS
jgi:GNAT superfamily N-acetyltransferase